MYIYQGTIITVPHDEAYVNQILYGTNHGSAITSASGISHGMDAEYIQRGELYILSNCNIQRYDGSFQDYKKQVLKKLKAKESSY